MKLWHDTINWLNEMLPREAGQFTLELDREGKPTGNLDVIEQPGWAVSLDVLEDGLGTLDLDQLARMDEDLVVAWVSMCYACVAEQVIYPILTFQEFQAEVSARDDLRRLQPDLPELTPAAWALGQAVDLVASLSPELFSVNQKDELAAQLAKVVDSTLHNLYAGSRLQNEGWYVCQPAPGEAGYDYPELHWNPVWNNSGPWQAFKES